MDVDFNIVKYQHVEKLGSDETEGIEKELCHVFPKMDGSNGVIWMGDDGYLHLGSRRRELTADSDNAGFYEKYHDNMNIIRLLKAHPNWVLYGEYMVKHTVKYKDYLIGKFLIFDIFDGEAKRYLSFEEYIDELHYYHLDFVPLIEIQRRITKSDVDRWLNDCHYGTLDGKSGEGIVIHAYDYKNKYGRSTWAKVIRDEYKAAKHEGKKKIKMDVEMKFIDKYCTEAFVGKEYNKLLIEELEGTWDNKYIPRLLNTIYHTLIKEHSWDLVKENKNPRIDFAYVKYLCDDRVKLYLKDIF